MHGIFITDSNGILTASFTGIHQFRAVKDGSFQRSEIAKGDPAPSPKSGSSDVAVGHLGTTRILDAIEPWHGNQTAVYIMKDSLWAREVIDDSLLDGHTI